MTRTTGIAGYMTQFQVLIKVSETGNLSRAARELGLTPSAVSKSLSALEEKIGCTILNRESRPFQLTSAGRRLLHQAHRLMGEIETVVENARQTDLQGTCLRITSSVAFGCSQLPWIARDFQARYPGTGIQVSLDDRLVSMERGEFDIALRISSESMVSGCSSEALLDIHWFYCASPAYLSRHPPVNTPADLRFHHCLVYPQMTSEGRWLFRDKGRSESVRLSPHLSCNSSLLLLQSALLNEGVVCLPDYLVNHYLRTGKLIRILADYDPGITHRLYALVSGLTTDSRAAGLFIDFLRNRLRGIRQDYD